MIPSTSGGSSSAGCNPISSNCVIWQGPDIPCINLCTGDNISQVLAKIAEMMCALEPSGPDCCDVSLLDPGCLEEYYKTVYGADIPDDWVLQNYINLLIEYVCQLDGGGGSPYIHPNLPVPNCVPRVYLNGDQINLDDGMELILPDGSIYMIDIDGMAGQFFNGNYTGWADMVVSVMCNLLACCVNTGTGPNIGTTTTGPGLTESKPAIIKIVEQQFTRLSSKLKYVPPKVIPRCVTNKVGRPVEMNILLSALEKEFCTLRSMTGTSLQLRDSIKKQCMNLNSTDRLMGNGTFGTKPGWYLTPSNLAESHANQWALLCEITDTIKDIQKNHLGNTSCDDIIYDAKCSLTSASRGSLTPSSISIDFSGTSVKAPFTDCSKLGAKITVVDSSLTSIIKHVPISQYQNSNTPIMVNFANTKIDRTSNYQVTIDFCFTDETFTCAKTITYTVENDVFCPDIVISDITGNSFKYAINGLNPSLGYQVSVVCETKNGSEIGRVNYSNPDAVISGDFGGLVGGQSYQVYTEITSNSGNTTTCDKTLVTTLVPSCTTVDLVSSNFGDVIGDLQGATVTVGCYNDGADKWKTVAGFDSNHNFKVIKYSDPAADCTTGDIITYGTFTSDDPSLSIVCGGKTYVSGFPQSSLGSGWQYVNTMNGPDNNPYYIYALVNKVSNSIDQVIACCDCKAVYIKTHNTMSYCATGKQTDIKIDVAGFVSGLEKPKWSLSSPPFHGSAYLNNTKSTATEVVYTYINSSTTSWTSDSFRIKVENNCGTSNELIIPVSRAREISKRDGDITVFVDTCTITKSQADLIKTSFESLKGAIQVLCSNWNGTINYVPVDSIGDSGDYINHAKAMIDMRAGATGSVTVAGGAWTAWKSLPAHWDGTHKGSIPTSAYIFSFVNNVSTSCGSYGEATLSAGFGAQPTASYQQNYDELLDIVNGTTTTAWGASMNSTQPGWGYPIFGTATDKTKYFSHVVMPIITGTNDSSAGAALQMAGAILGKFVNTAEFNGLKMGDVQYPINASSYILNGTASYPVPYDVTTPRGNAMTGLQDYGYLNAAWLENGVDFGPLNLDLKAILLSIVGLTEGSSGFNCVSASSGGIKMADSGGRSLFSFGSSCANASAAARSSTNPLCIYNNTGVIFDGSVGNNLAYKTQQGCSEAVAEDQIDDGWYAVITAEDGYGVGQYTEDSGWSNVQCTNGSGGCKTC